MGLKFCTNCRHLWRSPFEFTDDEAQGCKAFVLGQSLVTGYKTYTLASEARADESMCGKEAKCFEARFVDCVDLPIVPQPEVTLPDKPQPYQEKFLSSIWRKLWRI